MASSSCSGSIAALLAFGLLAAAARPWSSTARSATTTVSSCRPTRASRRRRTRSSPRAPTSTLDGPDWAATDFLGTVRIRSAERAARLRRHRPRADVAKYLGRGRARRSSRSSAAGRATRTARAARPASPPEDQTFWAASATGAGEQTLDVGARRTATGTSSS